MRFNNHKQHLGPVKELYWLYAVATTLWMKFIMGKWLEFCWIALASTPSKEDRCVMKAVLAKLKTRSVDKYCPCTKRVEQKEEETCWAFVSFLSQAGTSAWY